MKQHVSFVGALHIGFGILGLVGALAVYITFNFAHGFVEHEPVAEQVLETARMPTFGFSESDAAAVTVALLSLRARPVSKRRLGTSNSRLGRWQRIAFLSTVFSTSARSCCRLTSASPPILNTRFDSSLRVEVLIRASTRSVTKK